MVSCYVAFASATRSLTMNKRGQSTWLAHAGVAARYPTPLRYRGGKGKLGGFFARLLVENDLVGTPALADPRSSMKLVMELIVPIVLRQTVTSPIAYVFRFRWRTMSVDISRRSRVITSPASSRSSSMSASGVFTRSFSSKP